MIANVKMDNGGGAAFVLRATDPRNYYLLEIGGPKAPWGEIARLSVVQNGTARILNSASTVPFRTYACLEQRISGEGPQQPDELRTGFRSGSKTRTPGGRTRSATFMIRTILFRKAQWE